MSTRRTFSYPKTLKKAVKEREIQLENGPVEETRLREINDHVFELCLTYLESNLSKKSEAILKTLDECRNQASRRFNSVFPPFIVKMLDDEVRKHLTPEVSSINVAHGQVGYVSFEFAPAPTSQGRIEEADNRVDHHHLSVRMGKKYHLKLMSRLITAIYRGLGYRFKYCKGAVLTTTPNINADEWEKNTIAHCDFEPLKFLRTGCMPFTFYMPLQTPVILVMSSICCKYMETKKIRIETEVELEPGDFLLFSCRQFHRTGCPVSFPTTTCRRVHFMMTADQNDIKEEDEEEVYLHPTYYA
jgi:hypothetical protein